jgi:quercetin dioxygenase-like cupin family protein
MARVCGQAYGRPMSTSPTLQAVAVAAAEGEARWWFQSLSVIKATAADTGGRLTIVEVTEPPGAQAPLHVHHREDEAFWILEGSVTLYVGDAVIEARAGDYAFGPRDIPHRYEVGPEGCRMLFICTPGGFEDLVREMSVPAAARTLPPPADTPPDMQLVAAIAVAHGCELLE